MYLSVENTIKLLLESTSSFNVLMRPHSAAFKF